MPLPEYIVPMISVAGPAALIFVILCRFPSATRAIVTLVAGLAAVLSKDKDRREASIRVLDVLSRQGRTPGEKAGALPGGIRRARRRGESGGEGTIP